MKRIMAMVLAGGRVDELDVLTFHRPKSTLPFGGMYRIIDFPLSNLMYSRIEKVGVLSQYHSASLVRHIGIGSSWDMVGRDRGVMVLPPFKSESNMDWYKGTADAVYQNLDFINEFDPELILVLSGDHVYHIDYNEIIEYHITKQADLTAVFKEVPIETAYRYGIATIDNEDGRTGGGVIEYHEKSENTKSNWASLTIYLFNADVLRKVLHELINSHPESYEFGHDIIPRMVNSARVYGFKFYDYWAYSRTIPEYWQANMDLLSDHSPIDLKKWEIRTNLNHRSLRDRTPTIITEQAKINNCLIYNGCIIEGQVSHSVIFPGVTIEAGAKVNDSIVMFDTIIKKNSIIEKAILDTDIIVNENCLIGKQGVDQAERQSENLRLEGITIVGQSTVIEPNTILGKNRILCSRHTYEQFKD